MMKRLLVLGALVSLVALAYVTGCSESRTMIGADDDGASVRVGVGQVLELQLESNPTTGYSWQLVEVPEFLVSEGLAAFVSGAQADVVGTGGTETFRFAVEGSGTGTLRLEYARPWEDDEEPVEVYEVELTAR